ncbi:MAG: FtsX-like permease family protein [Acidimicrobiales bacterium]
MAPAEVRETEEATGVIWGVIAFVVLTVVATVANSVAATVRRRRGDYAILKALGLRRWQVRATVAWQAVAAVALALVIGLPLGVATGRWAWRLFAQFIGVIDTPVVPVLPVLGVAVGALVATGLVALGPGVRAGRVPPVTLHPE